jgi:alkylated DNA repair dioxygenase AlkB
VSVITALPVGFVLISEFLTSEEESRLLQFIGGLEFHEFQMRGVTAKRRVLQFGWHYSFESFKLTSAAPMPAIFEPVRERAASVARIPAEDFAEVLLTEYRPGARIGWHRDAPPFGIVAGVSLAGSCRMRFQNGVKENRETAAVELPPRSLYLLTGEARTKWEHTIPPAKELRYSITFRTLRKRPRETRNTEP